MKNSTKKSLKASNGITLIALVVTIIILLILATISIGMLSGNNGILKKSREAKTNTEIGKEKETIELAYNSAVAKKVSNGDASAVTAEDLNTELTNQGASADGSNPIKVTFTDSQRQYTINNGVIEYAGINSEVETQGKTLLQALKDNDISIGDFVNYKAPNVTASITAEESGASNQTINYTTEQSSNSMAWRILGYGNSNGELTSNKIEATNVLLISATGTNDQYLELGKEQGYLNGPTILNELCSKFSTDKINASTNFSTNKTTGRSVKIEDLYTSLGWSLEEDKITQTYTYQNGDWVIGNPSTQITTDTDNSNRDERTIQTLCYVHDMNEAEEENPLIWDNPVLYNDCEFWLASVGSAIDSGGRVNFGTTGFSDMLQNFDMFWSDGTYFGVRNGTGVGSLPIRPIISLSSSTMYGTEEGEITTIENPLQ